MSTFSAWSYTATATIWTPSGYDAFSQPTGWGATVVSCSYASGGQLATDDTGVEFVPRLRVWAAPPAGVEIRTGDRVKVGTHDDATPPDDAQTVRSVETFDPSTFNEGAADILLRTS